jgi:MFS family permease
VPRTPPSTPSSARTPGLLRHTGFQRLWLANLAGDVGQQFSGLALSVTAVLVLRASASQVGVITALSSAGALLLGLPVGVWIDRWRKKPVLVASDAVRALAVLSVPIAHAADELTIGQLMVVAGVLGVAAVFFDTAHTSVLPVLVSRERVSEANARLQTSDTTMGVVGPGVAGQLLRITSGPALYLVTAGMHLVSTVLVAAMPVQERATHRGSREPFVASLTTGLRFVVGHPVLRTFMSTNAAVNVGAGIFLTIVPIYVLRDLAITPQAYGLVVSVGATGGIVGSLIALRVKRRVGEIRTKVLGHHVMPVAFALVPLASATSLPAVVFVGAAEFLAGLVLTISSVSSTGVRAKVTPLPLMGRVSAASRFVTFGATPVGALLAGALAGHWGHRDTLWVAVGFAGLGSLLALLSPLRGLRDLPADLEAPDPDVARASAR